MQKKKKRCKVQKKGAVPVFGVFMWYVISDSLLSNGLGPVIAQPGVCEPVEPSTPVDKGQQGLMSGGTDMHSITNPEKIKFEKCVIRHNRGVCEPVEPSTPIGLPLF